MNLWKIFFGKDPKDHFLGFDPSASSWRSVTWNFDLESPRMRQWTIEVHQQSVKVIEWSKEDATELKFFDGSQLTGKKRMQQTDAELLALMNISIHSTLKQSLEGNQEFMLTPVSGATTLDFQNEARALQWIQTSFTTLSGALKNLSKDSSLILTAAFFSGVAPEAGGEKSDPVLRIIVFNLDITLYLRMDFSLHIIIFDDKNLGHGESKTPVFQQIIKVTKPQFYDEIVKLLHHLAQVGEIK
ncbi:MAG TPA: hypothetical protein VNJ01_16045 [Bacteriovoracaceae bacterium]|nr:hypothetical protein [Bacteriovoracaceae bacterium]